MTCPPQGTRRSVSDSLEPPADLTRIYAQGRIENPDMATTDVLAEAAMPRGRPFGREIDRFVGANDLFDVAADYTVKDRSRWARIVLQTVPPNVLGLLRCKITPTSRRPSEVENIDKRVAILNGADAHTTAPPVATVDGGAASVIDLHSRSVSELLTDHVHLVL